MRGANGRTRAPGIVPPPIARTLAAVGIGVVIAVATVAANLVVTGSATSPGSCPVAWQASPPTATPIQHLFVLVKENHAFENYFGDLPGVLGNPPNGSFPVAFNSSTVVPPFALPGSSTPDMPHTASAGRTDLDHGRNDLFVAEANASGDPAPQDAVGYYTSAQLPDYYAYARNYAVGDRFFTGVLGPTDPNRVFDLSANVGTWNADSTPPANVTDQPTVLNQLTDAAVPWEYEYASNTSQGLAPDYYPSLVGSPCNAPRLLPVSDLAAQVNGPAPPSVVYLDPSTSPLYSEHPPENVTLGEAWTVAVVNEIEQSPIWNSSAIVVFYDENGGFWDPLVPPTTSTGMDGFRVPFLVISPWTPAGSICSEVLDPASILHFIDANWNLPWLNARVASAPSLSSCFFDFSQAPRAPFLLPTNVTFGPAPASPALPPLDGPATHRSPGRGESERILGEPRPLRLRVAARGGPLDRESGTLAPNRRRVSPGRCGAVGSAGRARILRVPRRSRNGRT